MRCLFLGSQTTLCVTVLRELLQVGAPIEAVVVPTGTRSLGMTDEHLPLFRPERIDSLCDAHGVRLLEVTRTPSMAELRRLGDEQPAWIVCACFPFRLPTWLLDYPACGCVNIHPSLLPTYRGPAPVFWQLRAGERTGGVTVHRMSDRLDSGNIVFQSLVDIPIGVSMRELEQRLGMEGALLIWRLLEEGATASLPQHERTASYHSWPGLCDFSIDTGWSAERVFRFLRGTREMGRSYLLDIDGQRFRLASALMHSEREVLGKKFERFGADLRVQFRPGVVHVTLSEGARERGS